jgi:hypothetical protein
MISREACLPCTLAYIFPNGLSGLFEIKIDRNKKIIIAYLNIVEIIDDIVYAVTLRPTSKLIPAYRLG